MKFNKQVASFGLLIVSAIATVAATWLDIQDTIETTKEMYKDDIRELAEAEVEAEDRTKAS